jgi:hypothetical protein
MLETIKLLGGRRNDPEHWRQQAREAPRSWKKQRGLASIFTRCKPLALIDEPPRGPAEWIVAAMIP